MRVRGSGGPRPRAMPVALTVAVASAAVMAHATGAILLRTVPEGEPAHVPETEGPVPPPPDTEEAPPITSREPREGTENGEDPFLPEPPPPPPPGWSRDDVPRFPVPVPAPPPAVEGTEDDRAGARDVVLPGGAPADETPGVA